MQVAVWMASPVRTVTPTTRAAEAVALCRRHRIRHLPVMEGERVVGVVTDRDLRGIPEDAPVSGIMSRPVVMVSPRTAVDKAARLLFDRRIGCLPVIEEGRLVGILTQTDAVAALVDVVRTRVGGPLVDVTVAYRPDAMARAHAVVRALGAEVARLVGAAREPLDAGAAAERVRLNLETREAGRVVEALRAAGLEVVGTAEVEPGPAADEPRERPGPAPTLGSGAPRRASADAADLAAVIERAAVDLSVAEEPARFVAALETGAPDGSALQTDTPADAC